MAISGKDDHADAVMCLRSPLTYLMRNLSSRAPLNAPE